MNRLIKAETYKFLHSGASFRILIIVCLALLLFPLVQDFEFMNKTLYDNLESLSMGTILLTIMVLPAFIGIYTTTGYTKKTAYYEVMAGNSIWSIIGSKVLVNGVALGSLAMLSTIGMGIVVMVKNGSGGVDKLGIRVFLLFVIYMHIVIVSVLIGMAIKSIAGGMVAYLRFVVLDTAMMLLLPLIRVKEWLSEEVCHRIYYLVVMNQMGELFGEEICNELIVGVLASFGVEVLLWYSIVYYTMKKRLYK
ncbi:MAG: hypothetical protein IJ379_07510 [Lachnospiraceae bacterium]|nr:hypothetical protein [Lachnospiraceae bacterium]